MGCHASKLYRQKDRVKSKVTSLLRWRLDAIKRGRSHSSISKQMLLKPDSEDGSINDRKSIVLSYRELDDGSVGAAKRAPESIEPPVSDDVEAMEKLTLEEKDHNMDEEIERLKKERPTGLIFPGSPSFRFYLTDNDKEEDCSSKDGLPIKGSFSDADVDAFEPRTSADELGSNMKKRGRRGMRFRRVIPMGRPVKNFLKGRTCYYPSWKINRPFIPRKPAAM
ncbi:hypothetical protein HRI_004258800 [Hibiscus trionum]|uniref:Uncharacterized protein n=1 Tax=Hibiscus trionum TaxID=183268 RepID=A0A9W7J185_HIBTR|nr:hypothetical protein HRI_004258800 [Hibiscus trionum]